MVLADLRLAMSDRARAAPALHSQAWRCGRDQWRSGQSWLQEWPMISTRAGGLRRRRIIVMGTPWRGMRWLHSGAYAATSTRSSLPRLLPRCGDADRPSSQRVSTSGTVGARDRMTVAGVVGALAPLALALACMPTSCERPERSGSASEKARCGIMAGRG